jgi:hypothetical protein
MRIGEIQVDGGGAEPIMPEDFWMAANEIPF